jgi:hypothetical protein
MADAKPVETAPATPPDPAAPAKAGLWTTLFRYRRAVLTVGGSAALMAAGAYGYKHFTADPGKAVAQSEPPPAAKPDEPVKRPAAAPTDDLDLVIPPVSVVGASDRPAAPKPADLDNLVIPPPPGGNRPTPTTDDPPPIVAPPIPKSDLDAPPIVSAPPIPEKSKPMADPDRYTAPERPAKIAADDDFRAPNRPKVGPAPLPADVIEKKELPEVRGPIIRSGGTQDVVAPPVPKKDEPPIPKIDFDPPPPPPPVPMTDRKDDTPSLIVPPKKDDLPTLIVPPKDPATKKNDLPAIPKIDLDLPPSPPVKGPGPAVDVPPPLGPMPPAVPAKKDTFDEDWHTPRAGEGVDFAAISREYYKTADYARALEGYNKDRRERIVRVPPTWVLEERFPTLVPKDKPAIPEARPTANVTFDPAAAEPPSGRRPAPPPAAAGGGPVAIGSSNDEYKVTAANGESIRDVAQKVLGNPNAWRKVWTLNPDVDPTQPIPAGTTLRLPR